MSLGANGCRSRTLQVYGLRWWIAVLLFVASLVSYIDRLTLSILAPTICADLHLSNLQYASISVWFLAAYSFGQTVFGKMQDRIGTKRGLSIAMVIWSIAETAQALTRGLFSLCFFRFFLGLGEGGHWPAAIKGVAEWFPRGERAFGIGIVNTGATLGSALAPPLIVWLQLSFGWRITFVATGLLGFVWLLFWAFCYQSQTSIAGSVLRSWPSFAKKQVQLQLKFPPPAGVHCFATGRCRGSSYRAFWAIQSGGYIWYGCLSIFPEPED